MTTTHIERLLSRLTKNKAGERTADLIIGEYDMITSFDARDIFNLQPEIDIIFVYFQRCGSRELNVCFQRAAFDRTIKIG